MRGNMSSDRQCTGSGTEHGVSGGHEKRQRGRLNSYKSLASLAVKMDVDVGRAKAIIVYSESGAKARCVAKFRQSVPVAVLTLSPRVERQCYGMLKR
jgi:pyruvate kinase